MFMYDYGKQNFLRQTKKRSKKKKNFKRFIIPLFILGLIIAFLGRGVGGKIGDDKQRITEENKETRIKEVKKEDVNQFFDEEEKSSKGDEVIFKIKKVISEKQGEYAFWIESFSDGERYGLNFEKGYIAASINKIPIVVQFLLDEEAGLISFTDKYKLQAKDIEEGTGGLQYKKLGSEYSYEELVSLIGKQSDNTATNAIVDIITRERVQQLCDTHGMEKTNILENTTSAKNMGELFGKIYKGEVFKDESSRQFFFDILTKTDFEDRIPAGVPEEARVVHKIGNQLQVWSDCGLVLGAKNYAICILTKGIKEEEAKVVLPRISELVWEYESQK